MKNFSMIILRILWGSEKNSHFIKLTKILEITFYFWNNVQFSMPCVVFHLLSFLSALLFQWLSFCITILYMEYISKKHKMKHACNAIADSNYYSRNSTTIILHAHLICFFILYCSTYVCTFKELSLDQSYNHRKKRVEHQPYGARAAEKKQRKIPTFFFILINDQSTSVHAFTKSCVFWGYRRNIFFRTSRK